MTVIPARWATAPTGARIWLALSNGWRYPLLWASRWLGFVLRIRLSGLWPYARMLAFVLAGLIAVPLALGPIVSLLQEIGVNDVDPAPTVGDWLSLQNAAILFALGMFLRWIAQARKRVVVEGFVDYTTEDEKAVSGLSTLLVTELGRLRDLYNQATELSVPTAVGVERQGGFNRGKEAASFLTVSADDVTSVLEGAVASEATVEVGPAKVSLRPILAFFNRLTRGPRVMGTVHLTEAGGGPTLTAQLVGAHVSGTWRVDHEEEPESAAQRKAFLDTMVRELACRMFTQLTLGGSVRWEAVRAFNEYLRLHGNSLRTPRDRARYLKQAQAQLLEAVSEDERFDLAYYNLGVIYTQLAQAERRGEQQSDDATSQGRLNEKRRELDRSRREAARVAFSRAAEKNPGRWEAHYALAVTTFSEIPDVKLGVALAVDDSRRGRLNDVIRLCDQALEVSPPRRTRAAVYDLRGMAETRLGRFGRAMRTHRKAVRRAWLAHCFAELRARARPTSDDDLVLRAKENATGAIHNLGLAHARRALLDVTDDGLSLGRRLDLSAAARIFRWAIKLAGEGDEQAAASHFERGLVLERRGKHKKAAREFESASQIHLDSCEYPARRALALARGWKKSQEAALAHEARDEAELALRMLARPFSLAVTPLPPQAIELRCDATLDALAATHEALAADGDVERIDGIRELKARIRTLGERDAGRAIRALQGDLRTRLRSSDPLPSTDPSWEIEQLELSLGRLQSTARRWEDAEKTLERLIGRLREAHPERLVEFGVYAHHARALRETGEYRAALDQAAECVRRDPLNVEGRREAGRAHFALGQFADALASWKHALWLSPSDPYLHYEVGVCNRRMAASANDEAERVERLASAASAFATAEELFDGEHLDGQAWARLWRGRVALERERPAEAVASLEGACHGTATAAASLLLGETYLALDRRSDAQHAFRRCERIDEGEMSTLPGRTTIDAGWGDELPRAAVEARCLRGLAEAVLAPGNAQDRTALVTADTLLRRAKSRLRRIKADRARDEATALVLDTRIRLERARGNINAAFELTRERLHYPASREALEQEAELLELLAAGHQHIDGRAGFRLAATQTRAVLARNGGG